MRMSKKEKDTPVESVDYLPNIGSSIHKTVYHQMGGTIYEVSANYQGSETLMNKITRLLKSENVRN